MVKSHDLLFHLAEELTGGPMQIFSYAKQKSKACLLIFFALVFIHTSAKLSFAQPADEGKAIFERLCVACHTIGGGKRVGPDLKGVTERRDPLWLKGFIQSPPSYFATKDETAAALLKEFSVPMPDLGLKESEVEAVIAYLKDSQPQAGGTTTKPPQYIPTLLISLVVMVLLTLSGWTAGKKKVEVRDEKQMV